MFVSQPDCTNQQNRHEAYELSAHDQDQSLSKIDQVIGQADSPKLIAPVISLRFQIPDHFYLPKSKVLHSIHKALLQTYQLESTPTQNYKVDNLHVLQATFNTLFAQFNEMFCQPFSFTAAFESLDESKDFAQQVKAHFFAIPGFKAYIDEAITTAFFTENLNLQATGLPKIATSLAGIYEGLLQLPVTSQVTILSHFPPHHQEELQCYSGTRVRCVEVLKSIEKELHPFNESNQPLAPIFKKLGVVSDPILDFITTQVLKSDQFKYVPTPYHVHLPTGQLSFLGADQKLIRSTDPFALKATRYLPIEIMYDFPTQLPLKLVNEINQLLDQQSVRVQLIEFSNLLQWVVAEANGETEKPMAIVNNVSNAFEGLKSNSIAQCLLDENQELNIFQFVETDQPSQFFQLDTSKVQAALTHLCMQHFDATQEMPSHNIFGITSSKTPNTFKKIMSSTTLEPDFLVAIQSEMPSQRQRALHFLDVITSTDQKHSCELLGIRLVEYCMRKKNKRFNEFFDTLQHQLRNNPADVVTLSKIHARCYQFLASPDNCVKISTLQKIMPHQAPYATESITELEVAGLFKKPIHKILVKRFVFEAPSYQRRAMFAHAHFLAAQFNEHRPLNHLYQYFKLAQYKSSDPHVFNTPFQDKKTKALAREWIANENQHALQALLEVPQHIQALSDPLSPLPVWLEYVRCKEGISMNNKTLSIVDSISWPGKLKWKGQAFYNMGISRTLLDDTPLSIAIKFKNVQRIQHWLNKKPELVTRTFGQNIEDPSTLDIALYTFSKHQQLQDCDVLKELCTTIANQTISSLKSIYYKQMKSLEPITNASTPAWHFIKKMIAGDFTGQTATVKSQDKWHITGIFKYHSDHIEYIGVRRVSSVKQNTLLKAQEFVNIHTTALQAKTLEQSIAYQVAQAKLCIEALNQQGYR